MSGRLREQKKRLDKKKEIYEDRVGGRAHQTEKAGDNTQNLSYVW